MDVLQFYLERHERLHSQVENNLLEGLTDEQIRFRFREDVNSIAWLVWHMTRTEDAGVNFLVAQRPQVLDEGWLKRLGLSHRDIGTGMTDDEVSDFSEGVDISALRDYHRAVAQRTQEIARSLRPEDLDEMVDPSCITRLIKEEAFRENGMWVADLWSDHTKGWALAQMGLTHSYGHLGGATVVRGLLGIRSR